MRVICGEHEFVVHVHLLQQLLKILAFRWFFHGLRAEPEVFADVFRRFPFECRNLAAHFLPCRIEPPDERWQPCETAFDEDNFERWKAFKNAFANVAVHLRMKRLRHSTVVFDVIGGPACTGDRSGDTAEVDADGEVILFCRFVDFPVFAVAERVLRACDEQDLDESGVRAAAVNLRRRQFSIFIRHDDGGAQPRFRLQPFGDLPFVDCLRERGTVIEVQFLGDSN